MKNIICVILALTTGVIYGQNSFQEQKIKELYDDMHDFDVELNSNWPMASLGNYVAYGQYQPDCFNADDTGKNDSVRARKNAFYFELFGSGTMYSVNYERLLPVNSFVSFSARLGASMDHIGSYYFPVLANVIAGNKGHYGEFGFGTTIDLTQYSFIDVWEVNFLRTFNIGYRYQKPGGKWLYRIALTPIWSKGYSAIHYPNENSQKINPNVPLPLWFGLSAGLRF